MVTDHPLRGADAVAAARRILAGELALPKLPVLPVGPDFQVADLDREPPVQKLWAASLIVPDLLLRAYEHTPDPAFFAAAKRYLRGFIEHERGRWLESGWTWNGHATTNRVAVLARYWKFARRIDAGDTEMAALVHEHAARLAARLAKPTLFVANTNYGLMQNLGLVELAAAFPSLPQAAERRALAMQRTERQLPFYMSGEGIVLEHSPGYHFHGVLATGFLVRVLQASGQSVPAALQRRPRQVARIPGATAAARPQHAAAGQHLPLPVAAAAAARRRRRGMGEQPAATRELRGAASGGRLLRRVGT